MHGGRRPVVYSRPRPAGTSRGGSCAVTAQGALGADLSRGLNRTGISHRPFRHTFSSRNSRSQGLMTRMKVANSARLTAAKVVTKPRPKSLGELLGLLEQAHRLQQADGQVELVRSRGPGDRLAGRQVPRSGRDSRRPARRPWPGRGWRRRRARGSPPAGWPARRAGCAGRWCGCHSPTARSPAPRRPSPAADRN